MQVMVKRPLIRTLVTPCPPPRSRLRPPPPATRGTDMLGRLIEWSVRNVFLVLVMTLAIVAGGIYALMNTPLDAQPDLSDVQVIVFTERSEEHTSELQSLMRISYAVFCLKKKIPTTKLTVYTLVDQT